MMTDGYVYIDENGKESARCSRKDGLGVEMLQKAGVYLAVISKEKNGAVVEDALRHLIEKSHSAKIGDISGHG